MGWILIAMIFASAFYSGKIIVEYTGYTVKTRPLIETLEQEASELVEVAEAEAAVRDQIRERIQNLGMWIVTLRQKVAGLKSEFQAEQVRRERLLMEVNRLRLKSGRKA